MLSLTLRQHPMPVELPVSVRNKSDHRKPECSIPPTPKGKHYAMALRKRTVQATLTRLHEGDTGSASTQLAIRWGLRSLCPSFLRSHMIFFFFIHFETKPWFCLLALLAFPLVSVSSSDKSVVNTCLKVDGSRVLPCWHSDVRCLGSRQRK